MFQMPVRRLEVPRGHLLPHFGPAGKYCQARQYVPADVETDASFADAVASRIDTRTLGDR